MSSKAEEEFIAREEAEKLHRLAQQKKKSLDQKAMEERKALHYMHCAKCGFDLQTIQWRCVEIEKCYHCGAVVLDDGELEKLAGDEHKGSYIRDFLSVFKH